MEDSKPGFWNYENKMVIILSLTFGFVMFDRFALTNLAPFIVPDLKLTNAQFGFVISAFAVAWAVSGFVGSLISDLKATKKKFLAVLILLFSLCSLATGLAGSFISLVMIRVVMGLFEGPILPLNQSFMLAQSTPSRRGFNMGVMTTSAVGLISSLLGPIIVVALAIRIGWNYTFYLTILPGLIISFLVLKVLIEPKMESAEEERKPKKEKVKLSEVFKNRNIIVSLIFSVFIIGWYVGMLSFTPLYLTSVKGLTPTMMSLIMSAMGLGAVVWGMAVPSLSDHYGRKPMIILFTLISIVSPLGLYFTPASSLWLMAFFAFVGWCGAGVFPLFMAAVPTESVNPKFASTAVASIQGFGELLGAVGGATVAGILADIYGLGSVMLLCTGFMLVATVIAFGFYETAPRVLAKRAASLAAK